MIFKDGKFIGGLKELLNIRESATSTASATSAARKTKKSASSTTKKTKITI
jgi:hypothetical protein